VRRGRSGRLLGRVRWPARGGADGIPSGSDGDGPGKCDGHRQTLEWRAVLTRLGPVRHRWDLAILCNLDEPAGRRPADLLAAINLQAGPGRQLSPQVQSGRLRALEHAGYVRHEDRSVMPLHRVYFLQSPGHALISDLSRIISSDCPASCAVGSAGDER
jgi:DNA-binding HxlR family transcriptional regulator